MSEHTLKIGAGIIVVTLGTVFLNSDSPVAVLGAFLSLVGGAVLLVGAVGAGVQAGTREVVAELRRSSQTRRGEVVHH